MNLEKLLDNYYAPKKGNELLVKLIENKLNERFAGIKTGERINLLSGKSDTEAYKEFQTLFSGIINTGETLKERLTNVNQFLLVDKSQIDQISINQAFSSILLIQELKEALENLEASAAGFQMETVIAQLVVGSILANNSIVDVVKFKDDFETDFSIKTLKYDRLEIKGSFLNLCERFAVVDENKQYEYLIITKMIEKGIYKFYEWTMPYDDFFTQIMKPKGFINPGVADGKFYFKEGVNLDQFQQLANKGITVGKVNYKLTKRIQKEFVDGREKFFIRIPVIYGEENANSIFGQLQKHGATQSTTPATAMIDRYKNLKFIENSKDYFENADALEVGTQFTLTQKIIKDNINQEGALIQEFNLSNETLKQVEQKYQKSLVGKMNQILRDNEQVLKQMNDYFATHNKESAEGALENMTKVRRGFRQFSKQLTPDSSEKEVEP